MTSFFDFLSSDGEREEAEVDFDEFREWFLKRVENLEDFKWKDPGKNYGKILDTVKELDKSLSDFRNEDFEDDMAPRLRNMGESNKEIISSRLQSFVDTFEVPEDDSYQEALDFVEKKSKELDDVSEKIKKSFIVLDKVQSGQTRNVMKSMKKLESHLEIDGILEDVVEILEIYSDAKHRREKIGELKDRAKDVEAELEEEMKEKERAEGRLKEVVESEESDLIDQKVKEVESIKENIKSLKDDIRGTLAPLKRGLKKLSYFGLLDEDRLNGYIQRPADAALRDGNLSFLEDLVEELRTKLSSGDLEFSDDERERLKRELEGVSPGEISDLVDQIQKLKKRIKEREDEIGELRTSDLQKDIKRKIRVKEEAVEDIREELDKRNEKLEELRFSLEERVERLEEITGKLLGLDIHLKGVES